MQRSNVATRRFYSAFYQWSLLTSPAPACQHVAKVPLPRRRQSTAGYGGVVVGHNGTRVTKNSNGASVSRVYSTVSAPERVPAVESKRSQAFEALQVQTDADRPFDNFEPWEFTIRERDAESMKVEIAVPEVAFRDLQRVYDKDFYKLGAKHGITIGFGSIRKRGDEEVLFSVILAGGHRGVASVQTTVLAKRPGTIRDESSVAHALPDRSMLRTNADSSRHEKSRDGPDAAPVRPSSLKVPRAFTALPIVSSADWPAREFEPWDFAVRARDEAICHISVQTAVPVPSMQQLEKRWGAGLERMATERDASIRCSPPDDEPLNVDSIPLHSVLLSGTYDTVTHAFDTIRRSSRTSPKATAVPRFAKTRISTSLEKYGTLTHAAKPLSATPFQTFAIRETAEDTVTVQIAIRPEHLKSAMDRYGGLGYITRRSGAHVELSEVARSEVDETRDASVASVLVTGKTEQAQVATDFVLGMQEVKGVQGSLAVSSGNHLQQAKAKRDDAPKPAPAVDVQTRTSAEHPFEVMKAWEYVTRFQSDTGRMLEMAVPFASWRKAENRRGENLKYLVKKLGGRVTARRGNESNATAYQNPLVSVVISGTFAEVDELRKAILGYKGPSSDDVEVTPKEAGRDQLRLVSHVSSRGQRVFRPTESQSPSTSSETSSLRHAPEQQAHAQLQQRLRPEMSARQSRTPHAVGIQDSYLQQLQDRLDRLEALLAANMSSGKDVAAMSPNPPPSATASSTVVGMTAGSAADDRASRHSNDSTSPATTDLNAQHTVLPVPPSQSSLDPESSKQANESQKHRELARAKIDYEQLGSTVKQIMRQLTHPVVVITTRTSDTTGAAEDFVHLRGVTVSSFNTVTMHPKPLISFNLKTPSRTWDAMQQTARIMVHVLAANPAGAAIAQAFTVAHENAHEPFLELQKRGVFVFMPHKSRVRAPELTQRGAVIARIRVDLDLGKCVALGDHVIVVGEVSHVKGLDSVVGFHEGALAYSQQGYRELGEVVKPMTGADMFANGEDTPDVVIESARAGYAQDVIEDATEELTIDEASTLDVAEEAAQTSQDLGHDGFQENHARAADDDETQGHPPQIANLQSQVAPNGTSTSPGKYGTQEHYITNLGSTGAVSDRYLDPDHATVEQQDFPKPTSDLDNPPKEIESADAATATPIRRVQSSFSSSAFGPRKAIGLSDGRRSAKPDLLEGMLMDAERRGAPEPTDSGRGTGRELATSREALPWGMKA
ncbi:hypothetical protein B0A48_06836 [Cryoendolithus antarcticus]|uniref:Flavin reductase like domain-containing protein n=1 Tax=Cryoendolithus antarcticus TaxID=1507870 RepID=A0A1V8T9F9_9PEZI|nr:hypothetical protein B0A48_06836 [Cryoendolithus antarcticus]